MPPPTVKESWLHGRRFGIVIDAGSSGSRLQIYSWIDPVVVRAEEGPSSYNSLPQVGKGTEDPDEWVHKVEPGISTFGDNPEAVASYLSPLLNHARDRIPPSLHSETSIFLLATAGMRLLPFSQQTSILNAACDFIRFHSDFRVDQASSEWGHCGSSIRMISGEEEGLFGWIAVNYLMDQFTRDDNEQTTYGFLDMGGASTQIAFEPSAEERGKTKNLIDVRLRLIGGEEIHHQVFVTTWLGYGTNQARERYLDQTLARHELSNHDDNIGPIPDPCLPRNLQLQENTVYSGHDDSHSRQNHNFIGTGSFEQCLKDVAPLLNKDAPCPDVPCLFNGVHVPQIDFSVSHFIGVSEYWYSSEHVFGLGGAYNFEEFERAASGFCAREWVDIQQQHEMAKDVIGDDSEDPENPLWNSIEESRLQLQCFKSAWLVNVLHEGIGLPRLVDWDGASVDDEDSFDEVENKAREKGLGRPLMQSLDTIGDAAISWALGKMVLEASREISPLSKGAPPRPLLDNPPMLYDVPPSTSDPLDEKEIPAFPSRSYRETAFGIFSYMLGILLLSFFVYRLRHTLSKSIRVSIRSTNRTGYNLSDENRPLSLEDGVLRRGSTNSSRVWQLIRSRLSLFLSSFRSVDKIPPLTSNSPSSTTRRPHAHVPRVNTPFRYSPPRSFPSPSLWTQSSLPSSSAEFISQEPAISQGGPYSSSAFPPSNRSSTPPIYRPETPHANGHLGSSLFSLPRSRNNSQMNLTALSTRQPMSRSGSSGQQTPTHAFRDEIE